MASLLKGSIAKQVAKAMKAAKLTLPATLTKMTPGTRAPGAISSGTTPTSADFAAQGWIDDYQQRDFVDSLVRVGDRRISLLGASIAAGAIPENDDRVTIDGGTYRVIHVQRDPASAVYTLQARR